MKQSDTNPNPTTLNLEEAHDCATLLDDLQGPRPANPSDQQNWRERTALISDLKKLLDHALLRSSNPKPQA